jgi:Zn-dependent M28 family amino/carboxypeptidase
MTILIRLALGGACFSLPVLLGIALAAQPGPINPQQIRADVKYLSSDLLEGRGVGTRGGDLATEYIARQLAAAGVKPAAADGTYFQKVPLVGIATQPETRLTATAGGKTVDFKPLDELVGIDMTQRESTEFEADAVFVGHGITAPEWNWDDFKGVDVKGKVLILFTNEPTSDDPKFFDGRALTYYGRWVYKYEEGLRRGARAVIIIHTTPTAGYGWEVVRGSWARELPYVKLAAGERALSYAGWLSREAGEKLLALAGKSVDELLAASEKPDFRPIELGVRFHGKVVSHLRELDTRNVAGIVEGSDPKPKSEVVIYTAHWDHLGIGTPVNGDSIYNGAIDNGTGCGIVLELARAWAALPAKPRRSALFLFVTAEEGGLKGSEYYAQHPLIPAAKTAIDLNFDAVPPWGRAKQITIGGAERTDVLPLAESVAKRLKFEIQPDAQPGQGHYFRSDHFSFARAGIPAFSIGLGTEFYGKPAGYGQRMWEQYNKLDYHHPSDEFHEDWDFTADAQAAEFGFILGSDIANQDKLPDWRAGDQFKRR